MKITNNFYLQEFVPKILYNNFVEKSIWFIDPKIVKIAEFFRKRFGKSMYINNWLFGGTFEQRGFRYPNSDVGSWLSQHKFGRAIDFNIRGFTSDEIRDDIFSNESLYFNIGITAVEHGDYAPTWVHIDIRPSDDDKILIIKPNDN